MVEAVRVVEVARDVADRPAEAPAHRGERGHHHVRSLRDPSVGGFEAGEAREARRDADGTAAVTSGREGDEPTGDRGRASSGRTTGGVLTVPRIAGGAVELGEREVDAAELGRRREPDRDRTGRAQSRHLGRVLRGDLVLQHQRGLGGGPPFDVVELLHPDRESAERERDVGVGGGLAGRVGVEEGEGVDVGRLDRGQRRVELLQRGAFAGSERLDERDRVPGPWCVGHRGRRLRRCPPTRRTPSPTDPALGLLPGNRRGEQRLHPRICARKTPGFAPGFARAKRG